MNLLTGVIAGFLMFLPLSSPLISGESARFPENSLNQHPGILAVAPPRGMGHRVFLGKTATPDLRLALKFVELISPATGETALTPNEAVQLIQGANRFLKNCGIELLLERFEAAPVSDYQVPYEIDSFSEFNAIRKAFQDPRRLLVVHTGQWDHHSLGQAQAWTPLPSLDPQMPRGTVIEEGVAEHAGLAAHEIAHALGLEHFEDQKNLMNPILGKNSTHLEPHQCARMKNQSLKLWRQAIRS